MVIKHKFSFAVIVVSLLSLLAGSSAYAQVEFNGGLYEFSGTHTITLTRDVYITKTITVNSGATLTLQGQNTGSTYTISNRQSGMDRMVMVKSGGKLIIKGGTGGGIVLDGGANFSVNSNGELVSSASTKSIFGIIVNRGTMELDNVTIQQAYGTWGAGIMIDSEGASSPNGKTTITNSKITKCYASSEGGSAIYIRNQKQCASNTPESCAVTIENTEISYCGCLNNIAGGTLRTEGTAVPNLYLTNVHFHNNRSYWGAGLYWNAHGHSDTKCSVDGCTFNDNLAYRAGGGMMLETTIEFVGNTTHVYDNIAQGLGGGGVYIKGYAGGQIDAGVLDIELSDKLKVYDNQAPLGGGLGLFFDNTMTFTRDTEISVIIDGCEISGNTTTTYYNTETSQYEGGFGGGIYSRNTSGGVSTNGSSIDIEIKLHRGTLNNNTAINGGGALYVQETNVSDAHADVGQIVMSGNTATSGSGGAMYIDNSKLVLGRTVISNNRASANGGGVCVVNNDFSNVEYVEMSGNGMLENNTAQCGGGMYVQGNVDMTYSGSIISNKATNGGGIFLKDGAKLTVTGGLLKLNRATGGTSSPSTGYQMASQSLWGMGGGIYLDSGHSSSDRTQLVFSLTGSDIGVYSNDADWGGDDIFANGYNTSATLPNISLMNFSGFNTPTDMLCWAEDYITNDPNYNSGTRVNTSWSGTNARYDDAVMSNGKIYYLDFGGASTKTLTNYLSLEVGYELVVVTLTKYGLLPGESAVITFTPAKNKVSETEYTVVPGTPVYRSVMLTCTDASQTEGGVVKRVAVPNGWWKVDETSWSWSYDPNNGSAYDKPLKLWPEMNTLEFRNAKQSDVPASDESSKVNYMKSTQNNN